MSVYRISYRYASALMILAEEKKKLKEISEDSELIFNTLSASRELRSVLKSPVVKSADKISLLEKIFKNKVGADTLGFMIFVVEKNRENILFDIFKEFTALVDKRNGVVKAKVISAVDLDDTLRKRMVSDLNKKTGKLVSADYKTDPDIIGGFVVRIEDTVYDASVKHQLSLLRAKFSEEINL